MEENEFKKLRGQDIGRNSLKDYDKSAVREYESELQSSKNECR